MGTLLPTTTAKTSEMERTTFQKVGSALFYAICSNTLVFVNKSLLTNDKFPSRTLLGCGQMISGTFGFKFFCLSLISIKNKIKPKLQPSQFCMCFAPVKWFLFRECRVISFVKCFPFQYFILQICWPVLARRRFYHCLCSPYCDGLVFYSRWYSSFLYYRFVFSNKFRLFKKSTF